ncbi:ORF3 [Pitorquevirus ursid7]|uniref:ORF3 n=1 Tax=Giant panda anellovirus TaxID=2016460 RepID=A0A220IGH0_9VIRU|nr:ORF3 [Giant panda anellovirus]ASH99081.1 ORF3 [Giant panda anellovirus]
MTITHPVQEENAPTASGKGILMTPECSKKKRMRELLDLLSTERKNWWRSSPNLFVSDESESELDGPTSEKKRKVLVPPTPTQKNSKLNVSGIWPHASDSDWSESEGGDPPRHPPLQ